MPNFSQALPDKIEAVIFDFDGVFTDNKVYVLEDGREAVMCSRGDGLMVNIFQKEYPNIPLLVISKERNPVVTKRCAKLKLECLHGIDDKITILSDWLKEKNIPMNNVVYLGNDLNDIECIKAVGCGVCVADGFDEVKDVSNLILTKNGGHEVVRELLEAIRKHLKK